MQFFSLCFGIATRATTADLTAHTGNGAIHVAAGEKAAWNGKLNLSGGTLTGFLTLHAAPTANMHAVPKVYADAISTALGEVAAALTLLTARVAALEAAGPPPTGPTTWDSDATTWDSGATTWDNP
jgi:hypothetical protein